MQIRALLVDRVVDGCGWNRGIPIVVGGLILFYFIL